MGGETEGVSGREGVGGRVWERGCRRKCGREGMGGWKGRCGRESRIRREG